MMVDRIEGRCNFGYTCCSLIYINTERERIRELQGFKRERD